MRRRRLATAAALGLAGMGLRAAGARRRGVAPATPVETPPAPTVRRRVRTEAPIERPPAAAAPPSEPARPPAPARSAAAVPPRPAPSTPAPSPTSTAPVREAPPRAADVLLLPRPAPLPVPRALPARAADVLLLPPPAPPARPRPRVTGPRLVAFAAVAVLVLAALAVSGPRGGSPRTATTTAAAGAGAPPAAAPAPATASAPVLAAPANVALRPFPAQSCRFSMPVSGWHVIWADLQQGETIHSEAGGPGNARIACDASAPGPPVVAARKAAADARLRAGYRGLALIGAATSALLIYEYDEPGLGRIRVEARFLPDGASLTASAPVARFAALAPVLEAVLASHGGAGT